MEYRKLGNTDMEISALSFGASSLGGVFYKTDDELSVRAVHVAIDYGINYIDVAPYYGLTRAESVLGKALSTVLRNKYYLATKVGCYADDDYDYSAARITAEFDKSLERLGVGYVDVLQCHDIEFADHTQIVEETLPALQKLKEAGKARYIGITGLPLKIFPSILDRVDKGVVDTVLSFCRYGLNDTSMETLVPYFKEKEVGIINASPTGMGLLTERGAPGWHPASRTIRKGCKKAVEYCKSKGENIVKLAIQFCVANPDIASTLVGTANPDNIRNNVEYASQLINKDLLDEVQEILKPIHNFNFTRGRPENRDEIIG